MALDPLALISLARPFGSLSVVLETAGAALAIRLARCKYFWAMLMLQIMHEATTAELAEILSVTRKTIALWSAQGIMVKIAHGRYDLKNSLINWASYQRCIFEGAVDPLLRWQVRRDIAWSEAHPQPLPHVDLENLGDMVELTDTDLELRTFEVELDDEGNIKRVIGEVSDDQSRS